MELKKQIANMLAFLLMTCSVFIAVIVTCDRPYYIELGYLIWLVAIISSSLESFLNTRRNNMLQYSLGVTRKALFKKHLRTLAITIVACIIISFIEVLGSCLVLNYDLYEAVIKHHMVFLIGVYLISNVIMYIVGYSKFSESLSMFIIIFEFIALLLVRNLPAIVDIIGLIMILISIILLFMAKKIAYTKQL